MSTAASHPGAPGQGEVLTTRRLSVLVVEDDEAMLELYRCQFEFWDLPVDGTWMSSASEALQAMANLQPDLLITDLSMPGVDGLALLGSLQRDPQWAGLNIVVVSGLAPEQIAARGGLPEAIKVLRKPVDFAWLRRHVAALAQTIQR
jgi:CheY-like chemotaxis protein